MKRIHSICLGVITAVLLIASPIVQAAQADSASSAKSGKLTRVTEKEASWAAEARKSYPLDVCVVSEEKLGSMGDGPEYVYRVDGQPDRLVVFCCKGCEEDFNADPAAHLAKIDAAKKSGATSKGPAKKAGTHQNH